MAENEKSTWFHESRWFLATGAVVALLGGIWGLSGAPKPWGILSDLFSSETALTNTEVILDTSAAMGDSFEGDETKLDAAARAIEDSVRSIGGEGLALRRTSPSCEEEPGDLLVGFGTDQAAEVSSVAEEQRPEGKSNITSAVIAALADFRSPEYFEDPPESKRVLVFTTGLDECFEGNVAEKIKAELRGAGINTLRSTFTLVALKASGAELELLAELEEALKSADVLVDTRTPNTGEELDGVIDEVKEETGQAIEEASEEEEGDGEKTETVSG